MRSVPADAADERHALSIGPAAKFVEFIIVDKEVLGAAGADDRLLAVSPGLAPFEHAPIGAAFALAEMLNDRADGRTERISAIYPGSESIMMCLRKEMTLPAQHAAGPVGMY